MRPTPAFLAALFCVVSLPTLAVDVVDVDALNAWIAANKRPEVVAPPPPPPPSATVPLGITGNWTLAFSDEFDGTTINSAKWSLNWFSTAGQISNAVNSAETAAYDPAQCSLNGAGELLMTAKAKPVTTAQGKTYQYVTCFLSTMAKYETAYGVFEARIWMPGPSNTTIPYNWGGWWGNGQHINWPDHGEIDVVENLSGGPIPHYHFNIPDMNWKPATPAVPAGGWGNSWHVYSVKWTVDRASFYYDGVWIGTVNVIDPNAKYWMLHYGTSTQHGGPFLVPATQRVDYVRIYKPV